MSKRDRAPPPTVKLSRIEIGALLHEPDRAHDPERETVELLPLTQLDDEPDVPEPPSNLARGSDPLPTALAPAAARPRLLRTNLRLEDLKSGGTGRDDD